MDTNMTFRIDSQVKAQMAAICEQLGISTSTAFNIFANAFVRNNGMPFPLTLNTPSAEILSLTTIRGWRNDLGDG